MKIEIGPYPKFVKGKKTPKRLVKIKIHGYDAWSADTTLAMVILPALKLLKKNKHGAPWTEDSDVPEELRSTHASAGVKENDYDTDENHFKRWDWILGEMIFAMNEIANDNPGEEQYHTGKADWSFKKIKGTDLSEMVRGPKDTYKLDKAGYEAYHIRIRNGTRLFGTYFQALWD